MERESEHLPSESSNMIHLVWNISWMLTLLFSVWFAGCCGLSFAWIIIGCIALAIFFKQQADRKTRRTVSRMIADEKAAIAICPELPSWVNFPEVERAEWINKILHQVWPYVGQVMDTILREKVEPVLRSKVPSTLNGIRFDTIRIGDLPPRIGGIKVHNDNLKRSEIMMDIDIIYAGDSRITLVTKGLKLGIEDLEIRGTMRIIFFPLIPEIPLIGGITMYFINRPRLDFDLTKILNVLETPGISTLLRNVITDAVASFIVLPNKMTFTLKDKVTHGELRNRLPDGVLRIKVVEGCDLEAKDLKFLSNSGTSDPYVTVIVGAEKFSTSIKPSTVNPVWNETFEMLVEESSSRKIEIAVFDKDRLPSRDESLGSKSWALAKLLETGYQDLWLPLDDAKTGKIHMQLSWLTLNSSIDAVKSATGTTPSKKSTLAKAVLIVHVDSASNLPRGRHSHAASPVCKVIVGNSTQKTNKLSDTINPVWEQSLRFFVQEPEQQDAKFQLWDHKKDRLLGSFVFRIRALLNEANMSLKQSFPLDDCSANSNLAVKLTLMGLNEPPKPSDDDELAAVGKQTQNDTVKSASVGRESATTNGESNGSDENVSLSNKSPSNGSPQNVSYDEVFEDSKDYSQSSLNRTSSSKSDGSKSKLGTLMRKAKVFSSSHTMDDDFKETSPQGEIKIAIVYREAQKRLVIGIFEARITENGSHEDNNNINPYVRIYLLPDRSRSTRLTTDVVKHTNNPEFSETLWYGIESLEKCKEKKLDLMLKSETPLIKKATGVRYGLGRTIIDLSKEDLENGDPKWITLYKVEED